MLTVLKFQFHKTYLTLILVAIESVRHAAIIVGKFLLTHFIITTVVTIILALIAFVAFATYSENKKREDYEYRKRIQEAENRRDEARRRAERESYDSLYKLLACRPNIIPDVSTLPAERQTFHLRYEKLKAAVCRPWAIS